MEKIRHSLSHILASAIQELYPEAKLGIGPAIDNGFYYDFDFKEEFSSDDLEEVEDKMRKIIKKDVSFERSEISKKEAKEMFTDEPFKLELLEDLEKASIYKNGSFTDLCAGPHVESTKDIPADGFKLDKIAGAYWKGSEENKMLTRIYGLAFSNKKELEAYTERIKEAEKRDHRKLGERLELFMFDDKVGQGLPLWRPKGALLKKMISDFAFDTYLQSGYEPVSTPHIASNKLWKHSGHVDFYKEGLYGEFEVEDESYRVKPMNCPFHVAIYKKDIKSYRDLPIRYAEMGDVYRYEMSGALHGLTRVRGFTQDDAHIICTKEQIEEEVKKAFELTIYILESFNFEEFEVNLSIRDPESKDKFIGSDDDWEAAQSVLKKVIEDMGLDHVKDVGGAVFYGPKIDIKIKDSIGRKWQLSTLQFDFNLPSRFEMEYIGPDGERHTPFMVHRALLGSLERFIGVLIEHYAGNFPLWISPEQIWILPIGEDQKEYAMKVQKELKQEDFRVVLKDQNETLGKKIRQSEIKKIPYTLIIGDREIENNNVSVRHRSEGDLGTSTLSEFLATIKEERDNKVIKKYD